MEIFIPDPNNTDNYISYNSNEDKVKFKTTAFNAYVKTTSTTANLKAQFKTFPTIEIKNYLKKDYTNKFELSRTPTKMNEIDLNDESKDLFFNSQSLAVHQIGPRSGSSKDALTIKLNKKLQHLFIRYNSKDQAIFSSTFADDSPSNDLISKAIKDVKDSQNIKVDNLETKRIFDGTSSLDITNDSNKKISTYSLTKQTNNERRV